MVKKSNWTVEGDEKLIELFKSGYTSQQIAKKLNRTKEAVQKRIQMFKKKELICEKDRIIKQTINREIRRAITRENSKFLSNKATIQASMSVYKNNSKGDLVLDKNKAKEQGFVYSWDMPGVSINEDIREFNKVKEKNRELGVIEYVKITNEELKNFRKEVRKSIKEISVKKSTLIFEIGLKEKVENYDVMYKAMKNISEKIGVKIIEPKSDLGTIKGVYYSETKEIALNPKNSQLQNLKTLIHELTHAKLHTIEKRNDYSKNEREFQAEMVAYIVCGHFGLNTSEYSLRYIKEWIEGVEFTNKLKLTNEVRETIEEWIDIIEKNIFRAKKGA